MLLNAATAFSTAIRLPRDGCTALALTDGQRRLPRDGFRRQTDSLTVMAFRLIVTRTTMRYNVEATGARPMTVERHSASRASGALPGYGACS
jgi:hypothetical protein